MVSIRAPARGATGRHFLFGAAAPSVSIRAPARGATFRALDALDFNPRPCARGDELAPTDRFQSAPLARGDRKRERARFARGVSIRAPARGATVEGAGGKIASCFNPRPCARGDVMRRAYALGEVSIRAPARGATPLPLNERKVSIRAPARGATLRRRAADRHVVSIRAPARGATATFIRHLETRQRHRFNPRPCARGDSSGGVTSSAFSMSSLCEGMFNPRPCARGDTP